MDGRIDSNSQCLYLTPYQNHPSSCAWAKWKKHLQILPQLTALLLLLTGGLSVVCLGYNNGFLILTAVGLSSRFMWFTINGMNIVSPVLSLSRLLLFAMMSDQLLAQL